MDQAIIVVGAIVGMLVWITMWVWLPLWAINYFAQRFAPHLPNKPIEIVWLQDPIGALRKSINSEEKAPYVFWTVLPFVSILSMILSWSIAPGTVISYWSIWISFGFLVILEALTEDTLQQRVFRLIAYVFLVLGLVFSWRAMYGEGQFNETFAANFATEFGSLALTMLFLDEVYRWRDKANQRRIEDSIATERKRNIIQQLGSRSNDFALEAARIVLHEGWLRDGSLVEANLSEANLQNANLGWGNLQSAYLIRANLQHSDLHLANLQNASLPNANLQHADSDAANLQRAILWDADLQNAKLLGAKFQNAVLIRVNLQHANLWGANLQYVDLMFAKLQKAVLLNADLQHADLRGSNLQQAILSINDLPESHYKQILIDQEDSPKPANFLNAKYDSTTKWPDGFDPRAAGAINVDEQPQ